MPTAIGTAYGEPWDSMEGGGTTSQGVKLGGGKQVYVVAVNPNIIPYGSKLKIPHNPFGNPNIIFTAADTGGAFHSSNKIDFYIADTKREGNHNRLFKWGSQKISYQIVGHGSPHDVMSAGQEGGGANMPGVPGTPGTPPQVTGKVIPESTNTTQAIIDSLLKSTMTQSQKLPHLGSAGSNPLTLAQNAVASGQYTTPAHTELGVTPGTPGQPAQPGGLAGQAAGGGWAFPVRGHYTEGRTDRGIDFETKPGTPIAAVGAGTIVRGAGGFPSFYIKLDHPIGGYHFAFIGHVAPGDVMVHNGQRVAAGQTIARTSHAPPLAENMPGHLEYGLAPSSSGIEAAHDDTHNTHSGNTLHGFLSHLFPHRLAGKPIIG